MRHEPLRHRRHDGDGSASSQLTLIYMSAMTARQTMVARPTARVYETEHGEAGDRAHEHDAVQDQVQRPQRAPQFLLVESFRRHRASVR